MVAFGHTATGALVGLVSYQYLGDGDPAKGLLITGIAGVISHYFFDFIPHGHFFKLKNFKAKIWMVILFDLLLSLALFSLATYYSKGISIEFFYIMFGIGGAQIPDVLDGLIYIEVLQNKGLLKIENSLHQLVHWHGRKDKALIFSIWDVWQISIFFIVLYLIILDTNLLSLK